MEILPLLLLVGIAVLFFFGKTFAPKIMGKGDEGANAWKEEAAKRFMKKHEANNADEAKTE